MNKDRFLTRPVLFLTLASMIFLTISPGLGQPTPCDELEGYLDCTSAKKADIVIVMDTTGSMGGIINQMKASALDFADGLDASGIDYKLGLTEYKDFDLICDSYCGDEGDFPYQISGLTDDADEFKGWIDGLSASGGYDWEESVLAAMTHTATDQPWRGDAQKIAILMCDAPPHPDESCCNAEGDTLSSTISDLVSSGVKVYVVYTGGDPSWATAMTGATGGKFYSDASSIRSILGDITGEVACSFNLETEANCDGSEIEICVQMVGAGSALIPYSEGNTEVSAIVKCPDGSSNEYGLTYDAAKESYCATVPACAEAPTEVTIWGRICGWRTSETLIVCDNPNCPEPADDNYDATEDTPLSVSADMGVLSNDIDLDGDALSVASFDETSVNGGTVEMNTDGSFTYMPFPDYCSEDGPDSFTYVATDGDCNSEPATVTIEVACVDETNNCPEQEDDEYGAIYGKPLVVAVADGILQNDDDLDGDDLTAEMVTGPSHGTLALNADGSFTYKPAKGFFGIDTFTYKAFDGKCYSDPATVTIRVAKCPWNLRNELYTATCGVEKVVAASEGILANDPEAVSVVNPEGIKIDPKYGTIKVEEDGSFAYNASKNINSGTYVQFKYTATNGLCEAMYQGIAKIQVKCAC